MIRRLFPIALLALAACNSRPDTGPVIATVIGGTPSLADASTGRIDQPRRVLLDALAQGLVRFDAGGQIEPGLAERWIVIDGGMSYIFRLREAEWSDGQPVTAEQVVTILHRQIAAGSRNPLAPFLTAIDEVVVMTPQVIEVRLKRPRPDLLKLFAQPEMALLRLRPPSGTGPFRIFGGTHGQPLIRPAFDPARADPDEAREPRPEEDVRLIGERAARAIARFTNHDSDLVTGGTFADWPLLATAEIARANLRVDPAAGLFGLAVVSRDGFLGDAANRIAIAQAIDRQALTSAIAPSLTPTEQILPDTLDSAAVPIVPAWSTLTLQDRRTGARAQVARWAKGPVTLRIALPDGPGATILYGELASSLMAIGITPERVAINEQADLKLIDAVAPYDSARWYLATACASCGADARAKLEAARDAPTLADRAARIAEADAAMADDAGYIPLARPLRWSLVALRLGQWQPNSRAWHPLNRLRDDTK